MAIEQTQLTSLKRPLVGQIIKWVIVLSIMGFVGWIVLGHQPKDAKKGHEKFDSNARPKPVIVAKSIRTDVNVYLASLGNVTPRETVLVKSLVDGQLMKLLFREGQMVKKNQPLAEIDPRPFEVALLQANGQLLKDKALLRNAQIDLDRYKTLFKQDSISEQVLNTQEALVKQDTGLVDVDQAQVDNAKLQLSYCHIRSPIDGMVGLRQVDPGNIIHASDAMGIVSVTSLNPMTVIFSIPEDSLSSIKSRMKDTHKLMVDAYDREGKNKLASGILLTYDNNIDPTTGTLKLRAMFANEDHQLFPNQFVNIKSLIDVKQGAIVVPVAAIQKGKNGDYVFIVDAANKTTRKKVTTSTVNGEYVVVDQGLDEGVSVVIDGADKLKDGSKVKVISESVSSNEADAEKHEKGHHRKDGQLHHAEQ
jgi:multidrug efflux system membrane fusion protein